MAGPLATCLRSSSPDAAQAVLLSLGHAVTGVTCLLNEQEADSKAAVCGVVYVHAI